MSLNHHPALTPELLTRYDVPGPRYTSYPTADRFVETFGEADYIAALAQRHNSRPAHATPLSLYVHVPFCESLCYYCACNKIITKHKERGVEYLDYLQRDIDLHVAQLGEGQTISQLHFGGGTPTFLDDENLGRLMGMIRKAFTLIPGGEYSIEVDPRTVDAERLKTLHALGFNRLSFGVQDFDPQVQQAVLRMQREITAQRLALVDIEQRRQGLAAGLNGLLGRAHDAPLAAPADPDPLPERLEAAALVDALASANPEVQVAANGIDRARAERERTYQDRLPDFAVGVTNNRPDEGKASWDVMFEVMIPLQQSSRRAREREAEYLLMAAEARREDARARASGELGGAASMYARGRETLRLLDHTLLPQAQATRDASRAALASGTVDFDSVIEAERQLIDIRMRRLQTELETRLALAEIKKLTGEFK